VKTGLVIGVATAILNICGPVVEWGADRVPEKRMGVFGVGLILIGFAMQSVQYWLALLDVGIR
jgi:putative Mn2+ efflux pump MntP